jgi:hypothetical protein
MMTRNRKTMFVVAVAALGIVGYVVYSALYTLCHLREAYAAWDTGSLLIEYMKQHDDQWPKSWDELLTVMDSESGRQIVLRGAQAGDVPYARSLRQTISVDWDFNPAQVGGQSPVTPAGGGRFPVVWQEPNEMIREYLATRPTTRPSASH